MYIRVCNYIYFCRPSFFFLDGRSASSLSEDADLTFKNIKGFLYQILSQKILVILKGFSLIWNYICSVF